MTYMEEMQNLSMRISNLEARIECAEDEDMALHEKQELIIMLNNSPCNTAVRTFPIPLNCNKIESFRSENFSIKITLIPTLIH